MAFDLKNYEDVQTRVKRFQEAYPMGRIVTEIVDFSAEKGHVLVKASCYRDDVTELPAGVDYAFGNVAFYPNHMKRFFIEDTSTSAIGRCISLVLPTDLKPTVQDMQKIDQPKPKQEEQYDYWAVASSGDEPVGSVLDQLKDQLGAEIIGESPICTHGHMILKEGNKPNGDEYRGYVCTEKARGKQCKAIWMVRSATTGQWRLP